MIDRSNRLFCRSGELFALVPIRPGQRSVAVEPVSDSQRYFVIRVEEPASGRHAFLGLGFMERGEAFDFVAALNDHEKQVSTYTSTYTDLNLHFVC